MALTERQQACLDRYLASFTPDIDDQRERIESCAREAQQLDASYNDLLEEIDRVRKDFTDTVTTLRGPVAGALNGDEDKVDPEALLTALDGVLNAAENFGHEMDEIYMEMVPSDDPNGLRPLQVIGNDLTEIHDELAEAARALDQFADRLGRIA